MRRVFDMELVKNIFFNTDKLVENLDIKVSYSGKLFQSGSETVFLHYGFGPNWDNVSEVEMEKTELGFQAELHILSNETLNICFRDNHNHWDNNDGENYIFPVEKMQVALVPQESSHFLDAPRKLKKTYIWSKKVRLAVYKLIRYIPKIISGNYSKKVNENTTHE